MPTDGGGWIKPEEQPTVLQQNLEDEIGDPFGLD